MLAHRLRFSICFVLGLLLVLSCFPTAKGQAWVSGVGDDANPCTRTAPCLTLPGGFAAISGPGGDVECLDAGDTTTVTTITQAANFDGGFVRGSITPSSSGIVVAAGASDLVIIRRLRFLGAGAGQNAIVVQTAGTVVLEELDIGYVEK